LDIFIVTVRIETCSLILRTELRLRVSENMVLRVTENMVLRVSENMVLRVSENMVLRVSENMVLREIFGSKRDGVTSGVEKTT